MLSRRGMVASSQPLAVQAAIETLRLGGNAIDAAVTATFVLNVVEPMSTGIGGDCFAIIYLAKEKKLIGINGTGRSPADISADALIERGIKGMPVEGPLSVTVPGALDALARCLRDYGSISLSEALAPAISYAAQGFAVTEVIARQWAAASSKLKQNPESAQVYLPGGQAPAVGQVFRNQDLEKTFRAISEQGIDVLYNGKIGESIASSIQSLTGFITLSDLAEHSSDLINPIRCSYRDRYEIIEMPPNSQGLAALIALNILDGYRLNEMDHGSAEHLHHLLEAMKLALVEAHNNASDPDDSTHIDELLSQQHTQTLRARIDANAARQGEVTPTAGAHDTVFVAAVDEQRNVVSMISSLYKAFGSGVTVSKTGIVLQNRGAGFTLEPNNRHTLRPRKRPYHTLMPAMILRDGEPWACVGVVGGMMQPQGQVQVISNLIDFDMDPQSALDAPRFRILEDQTIALEDNLRESVVRELESLGHPIKANTTEEEFGGGQVILIDDETLYGGSDKRKDGCAIGY
ncbi:MAG: gamma-glutamyltransferase [Pyrinomonadaceae bacterium]